MKANPKTPSPADIQLIEQALEKARPWGLEAELMWTAMRHQTICTDIEKSLEVGITEWDL